MITLISTILGFLGAAMPDLFKLFRERADRVHELKILQVQVDLQKQGLSQRMEEIRVNADIKEAQALYRTWHSGVLWVDALNGTVRPLLAYAFFLLYACVKLQQVAHTPWLVWGEEDQAIFAGIISFYFGQRAMGKLRKP